jgi:exodeoxyribonuclease VII small subunit
MNGKGAATMVKRMAKGKSNEFENAFRKLETIVNKLEQEELSLDESLTLFEEGIGLSRFCHTRLEEIEQKIETILADAKGDPAVRPFEGEGDAGGEEEGEDDGEDDDDGEGVPF